MVNVETIHLPSMIDLARLSFPFSVDGVLLGDILPSPRVDLERSHGTPE